MQANDSYQPGFIDYDLLAAIACSLLAACKSAGTPFDLDVAGAERLLRHGGIEPDKQRPIDLELLADRLGATMDILDFRGSYRFLGTAQRDARLRAIASSLVLVTESTRNFPFNDGTSARRLLSFMSIDVDLEGDVDLDRIATRLLDNAD